ncbi:hypothetical protein [Nonomuraea sp. NPDC049784]|uniref:hypothetical protein n=1 Tax=Nonomuraea sp. NPDC049784 TaxID=3154361 RepID=UPI0033FAB3B4
MSEKTAQLAGDAVKALFLVQRMTVVKDGEDLRTKLGHAPEREVWRTSEVVNRKLTHISVELVERMLVDTADTSGEAG